MLILFDATATHSLTVAILYRFLAFACDEEAAQDFARRRLRNLRDKLDAANLLVRRDATGGEADDLFLGHRLILFENDECLWHLARFVVRTRNDSHVRDAGMCEQPG